MNVTATSPPRSVGVGSHRVAVGASATRNVEPQHGRGPTARNLVGGEARRRRPPGRNNRARRPVGTLGVGAGQRSLRTDPRRGVLDTRAGASVGPACRSTRPSLCVGSAACPPGRRAGGGYITAPGPTPTYPNRCGRAAAPPPRRVEPPTWRTRQTVPTMVSTQMGATARSRSSRNAGHTT